jgi:HEPN domain-containing protein
MGVAAKAEVTPPRGPGGASVWHEGPHWTIIKGGASEDATKMDVRAQVDYWRRGAEEDMEVADELLEKGRLRHALFFGHLALEKMLKAHVTQRTADVPPRIHTLSRLAEIAGLTLPPEQQELIREFNVYHMEGRYPEELRRMRIDPKYANTLLSGAKEVLRWLTMQF